MVWCAIAFGHKWPLLRLPLPTSNSDGKTQKQAEGLTGARYVQFMLKGSFKDYTEQLRNYVDGEVMVVEDGVPSHSSKVAAAARREVNITTLLHPPSSPDLNAIEPLWMILKDKIAVMRPVAGTVHSMLFGYMRHTQHAWDDITIEQVNLQVERMNAR